MVERLSNRTPSKASEMAVKKNVVGIFKLATKHARAVRGPISTSDVIGGREAISKQLPHEDFDL